MPQNPTTPIYHVIYQSLATEPFNQNKLLNLLKLARLKNEATGLTGMLLYRDSLFLQYVEGTREDVHALLGRLKDDPRHKAIKILREGTVPERLFPEWSMAYKNLIGLRSSHIPGYSEGLQVQNANSTEGYPAGSLIRMFQQMTSA